MVTDHYLTRIISPLLTEKIDKKPTANWQEHEQKKNYRYISR